MSPYDTVDELERRVAAYGGSKYAVAVDSCTNALLLALVLRFQQGACKVVSLPKRTYVGVAHAVINAGGRCEWRDEDWQGEYLLGETKIVDAARRFKRGMYKSGTLYCVSCHWGKILRIGRGGFILTDNIEEYETLRRMRCDGRRIGVIPTQDNFDIRGFHCYMLPSEAAHGLMLMSYMPDNNADLPRDNYADLSQFPVFKGDVCSLS